MKVAIYCRVSTDDQQLDTQRHDLLRFCEAKGWEYEVFEEKESSRGFRAVKKEVMTQARRLLIDGVVVWKMDRWARSLRELITDIDEMCQKGIVFVSLMDNIDLSTPSGRLQFQIMGAFAEFERNMISQRTKEALRAKKESGVKLGRPKGSKDRKKRKRKGWRKTKALFINESGF